MREVSNPYSNDAHVMRVLILVPSSLYFQSGVRDFTLQMVRNLTGLSDQWAFRYQTIVDELCNNAIEYGSGPGDEIAVVFYTKKGEWLEVQVEDSGNGKNKISAAVLTKMIEEKKLREKEADHGLRGRGLARIVSSWTDELEFTDTNEKGINARARKYFHKK